MNVRNYIPTDLLKPFIKSYTVIETTDELETVVLPHLGLVLAIQFNGQVNHCTSDLNIENIPLITLSGMRKTFRQFNYVRNTGTILVTFKAGGASAFLNHPLHELFEGYQSLDSFFKQSEIRNLEDIIFNSKDNIARIKAIEDFLISKCSTYQSDDLIMTAINAISINTGTKSISSISENFGIGQDAFEKKFRKKVGATPKQFSSIVRMKAIIENGRQNKSLTDMAYEFSFFDQAHFIKDFKLFTGQSPTKFFRLPYQW